MVEVPFSKVVMYCIGPLPKSRQGNEFLFNIMDVTTRFHEAVPLRSLKGRTIIEVLVKFFVGFDYQSGCNMTREPILCLEAFKMSYVSVVFIRHFPLPIIPSPKKLWNKLVRF